MRGTCSCGAVSFVTGVPVRDPAACHCGQCRKMSGHFWASVNVPLDGLTIEGEVRWYESSPAAKRGFCPVCGSSLFWKAHAEDEIAVALGALEAPTGLRLERHIFVADKGDYYDITDSLPQEALENG
ncbi:Glutathione-dependent formaldehyde-activating enzyme [Flavimaricola marinus]|uniref:Glutathione-dependent formaldehyde-activating enzyme n=1 Tax=Flavimaricola marinus TaxID=1819565 RepID=A0A238LF12_9RHOB|nr:GFA family protein [Flavimaricola marinus]SMY08198.1 Glutathione-dependent formaldehyde-activating enzyme [Flavimaricola marinus]